MYVAIRRPRVYHAIDIIGDYVGIIVVNSRSGGVPGDYPGTHAGAESYIIALMGGNQTVQLLLAREALWQNSNKQFRLLTAVCSAVCYCS